MPPTQRLFIAVYPPAPAVTDLAGLVSRLAFTRPHPEGLSLRPVPPEQWHVTVAFLGELDPAQLDTTIAAMNAVASATPRAPRLRLSGGGRFPNGRAAAIWAGLHGDLDDLHELANRLRGALTEARVPFDPRPYQPHLTLARPGDRLGADELREIMDQLDAYAGPVWPAPALMLMRSDHPVSNHYTEVFRAPLPT
ncbi:RNA 2',3'-cyclic phosphodiesterase [Catellatospora chokoriensis]|uniref:RNA 2',3'-cyclic phosphodiesterase n=1 Tax=Catellatospora chokoriensis TaxID=310353 RepID=A0A8J3NUC6_9ACTN|nr:RNA 2',3'-cyclic phosphodiesterase [Catellatospora chokoriensis]GIF92728.1 RNA 2',3'-cyclic phosphodiesterase [Catellatospora chokoriensis]